MATAAMIRIDIQDSEVHAALNALAERMRNLKPVLQAIGDDLMERSKRRFETSTGPDRQRWRANARSTIDCGFPG